MPFGRQLSQRGATAQLAEKSSTLKEAGLGQTAFKLPQFCRDLGLGLGLALGRLPLALSLNAGAFGLVQLLLDTLLFGQGRLLLGALLVKGLLDLLASLSLDRGLTLRPLGQQAVGLELLAQPRDLGVQVGVFIPGQKADTL